MSNSTQKDVNNKHRKRKNRRSVKLAESVAKAKTPPVPREKKKLFTETKTL